MQGKATRRNAESTLDGIALGDKVIQVRNRPPSKAIWACCLVTGGSNESRSTTGNSGFVQPHSFDLKDGKIGLVGIPACRAFRCASRPSPTTRLDMAGTRQEARWQVDAAGSRRGEPRACLRRSPSTRRKAASSTGCTSWFRSTSGRLLSRELFYTGLTRAGRHCTLLIEEDISPLLSMRRLENVATSADQRIALRVPTGTRRASRAGRLVRGRKDPLDPHRVHGPIEERGDHREHAVRPRHPVPYEDAALRPGWNLLPARLHQSAGKDKSGTGSTSAASITRTTGTTGKPSELGMTSSSPAGSLPPKSRAS